MNEHTLEQLRKELDVVDDNIIKDLALRMEIIKSIAKVKKENKITIVQHKQWKDTLDRRLQKGISLGLSEIFIRHFLQLIQHESIVVQIKLIYRN